MATHLDQSDVTVIYSSSADRWAKYCAYFCMVIWGMGQLVPFPQWYLHGVTPADLLFLACAAFSVAFSESFRRQLLSVVQLHQPYVVFVLGMMTALLVAIWANSHLYDVSPFYILSTLRSGYFLLLSLVVLVWARQGYSVGLCKAYLIGLFLAEAAVYLLTQDPSNSEATACRIPVLLNPNVAGNMLGVGIIMGTLLVLERRFLMAFILTPVFAWESIYSFSKGSWGMVFTGVLALMFAAWYVIKTMPAGNTKDRARLHAGLFVAALVGLAALSHEDISCFVSWKLRSQATNGSIETRFGMLEDTLTVAMSNPLGVGTGRYKYSSNGISLGDAYGFVGYSSQGNPHSAFLYVLANGGVTALAFFIAAVLYPFVLFWRGASRSVSLRLCLIFAAVTFVISGSFQLQLFSQYFFWIFAGFLLALVDRNSSKSVEFSAQRTLSA